MQLSVFLPNCRPDMDLSKFGRSAKQTDTPASLPERQEASHVIHPATAPKSRPTVGVAGAGEAHAKEKPFPHNRPPMILGPAGL
jgi:hypothetical protein